MAQSYSLAVYAITINTRGNKNDLMVLSDFNNGQDILQYIGEMIVEKTEHAVTGARMNQ